MTKSCPSNTSCRDMDNGNMLIQHFACRMKRDRKRSHVATVRLVIKGCCNKEVAQRDCASSCCANVCSKSCSRRPHVHWPHFGQAADAINPYARGLTLVNGRMRHSFFEPLQGKGHDGSRGLTTETGATGPRGIGRGPSTQQHQHSCRSGSLCLLGNGTKVDTWWGSGCPFCRSGP